ncbi:MAG: hypothetical protein B7Y07_11355 [Halothiobacillus sp. 24-54-40]|jgi:hypothetical protein|nr:MAG: hypothetical protein B7Y58_11385 [Halothiobacillus sp. 35-54-62]OYZ85444.1 MAG: hypothetical protein B7Y07_11355 [Halothiobacillus sp. 24-54-40]OZA79150.1 MAG: hypothetical protein B7X64_10970 [Halothiobacillus sp. 39-53-45]HQS03156.1 type II secretion system protein GspG [Halothiobacillus sp.]
MKNRKFLVLGVLGLFLVASFAYFVGLKSNPSHKDEQQLKDLLSKKETPETPLEINKRKVAEDIAAISAALNFFKLDVGHYPSDKEGLQALVQRPSGLDQWRTGGYIDKLPLDLKGNAYAYQLSQDGKSFKVFSRSQP